MSKFAFSSSYVPGQAQETPFVDSMKAVLRRDPTVSELAILRRLLHECFAMTSTALKQIVEKTDDTPARKLSQPERSDRLERQQARLTGVRIQGVYEPSDRLIDRLVQMYEDNRLSYIELQACALKEFEVKHSSTQGQVKGQQARGRRRHGPSHAAGLHVEGVGHGPGEPGAFREA